MMTWAIRQRSSLRFELCGDSWLMYVEASGRTHLVDFLSGEVLLFLTQADRDIEALATFVAEQLGDREIAPAAVLGEIVQPLVNSGLIEESPRL